MAICRCNTNYSSDCIIARQSPQVGMHGLSNLLKNMIITSTLEIIHKGQNFQKSPSYLSTHVFDRLTTRFSTMHVSLRNPLSFQVMLRMCQSFEKNSQYTVSS